ATVPRLPPAPARFSTITGCPRAGDRRSASQRARISVTPPGPPGTMMRTGLLGQLVGPWPFGETTGVASAQRAPVDPRSHRRVERMPHSPVTYERCSIVSVFASRGLQLGACRESPRMANFAARKMLNGFADRRLPTGRSPRLSGLVAILAFVGAVHETVRAEQDRWAPARAAMGRTIEAHAASLPTTGEGQGLAPAVLDVMGKVPRHRFVPDGVQREAYADAPLPIGYGQTISQPFIVALMSHLARATPQAMVLEIGTGSG